MGSSSGLIAIVVMILLALVYEHYLLGVKVFEYGLDVLLVETIRQLFDSRDFPDFQVRRCAFRLAPSIGGFLVGFKRSCRGDDVVCCYFSVTLT